MERSGVEWSGVEWSDLPKRSEGGNRDERERERETRRNEQRGIEGEMGGRGDGLRREAGHGKEAKFRTGVVACALRLVFCGLPGLCL